MYGQLTLAAGDPTSDNHAARKAYVDTKMKLVWKQKLASGQVLHYKAKGTIANCKIVAYWE